MRRYKTSIAAACVLVLAIAGWFAADRLQVENKYNKESERTRLTDLDASEVEEISFENPEESFTLLKGENSFYLKDREDITDSAAVGELLENILKIDGTLLAEDGANATEYGLDAPKAVVRFKTKSKGEITVSVGNPTPAETEYYAMDGGGRTYSVYTEAGNALLTKRWQLMNLGVFSSNYEDIKAVSVVGQNAFEAEKQSTGIWSIRSVRDGGYEVTDEKFRGTVGRYFDNMYAKRAVLNTDENRARYGLDSPEGVITITDRAGSRTELKVTRDSENEEAAVIVNDGDDIFITIESYFGMLDTGKENLD